jgi:4-amino-4-deoxy-L-arabinose transferase-like glycosyltransferase
MSDTAMAGPSLRFPIVAGLGRLLARLVSRHERLFILIAVAVFGSTVTYHAFTTPLQFDEFFTLFISRLSSLSEMRRAMPADGQPPLQYLLTHVLIRMFGETEIAVRALELICYLAVGLLTYRIARHHGTAVQSLFALVLLMGSWISRVQAITARPYELLAAFTALTFACWQFAAAKEGDRLLGLCGVTFGVAGCILSHHFGIVHAGLFLAVGETVRSMQRRRLDVWMLLSIGAGMLALFITLPLAHQSNYVLGEAIKQSTVFWGAPKAMDLKTYLQMLSLELILYTVAFAFVMLVEPKDSSRDRNENEDVLQAPIYEWAAVGALCLLLPLQLALAYVKTGYFQPKYAIGTTLGMALAAAWGIPRLAGLRRIAQPLLAISTLVLLLMTAKDLIADQIHYPVSRARPAKSAVSPLLVGAPGDLPIVVANAFDYIPDWWYSPDSVRQRLIYLADVSFAVRQQDFLPELSLVIDNKYTPLPLSDYATFTGSHQHFLLLTSGQQRLVWMPLRLSETGWRMIPIAKSGGDRLYRVDRGSER